MFRRSTLLLIVLGAMACACAVPRADLPDTAYNEVDTPVSHASAVVPGIRLLRPASVPVTVSDEFASKDQSHTPPRLDLTSRVLPVYHRHSLHELLCTFLI